MKYYKDWYVDCKNKLIRVRGIPVIDADGIVKSIDIRKSWLNLYGGFLTDEMEMIRLEKKADKIISDLFYCMCNNMPFNIDILEGQLTEVYDRMFYMICTGEEDTLHYTNDWKEKWDETDENLYVDFYNDEKLFKYSSHVIQLYHKIGLKSVLRRPFKNYEDWPQK